MSRQKPIASLSLDLDNQWSYMKTHGDHGWESFPSYLDILVPRVLDFLKERGLTITFFIVGQDAALEKNCTAIRSIVEAGHEIANHSFHHQPWLHLYSEEEFEAEIVQAEEAIFQVTGQRTLGFRGPGYSVSPAAIKVLEKRGYLYDASTLPTYIGPIARQYYFLSTRLTPEEKQQRSLLFGTFRDGRRPIKPYRWDVGGGRGKGLVEIPVTTMPVLKIPFHFSYILYLSSFSPALAILYFRCALELCRLNRVQPSLLLHPLDFLDLKDIPELSFFPAMRMDAGRKKAIVSKVLQIYSERYRIVRIREHNVNTNNLVMPSFGTSN